jgi:hypothetical protein
VGVAFGLGILNVAQATDSSTSLSARDPYYPNLYLDAELWLTSIWTMRFKLRQGIGSTENPLGGSPAKISHAISGYDFLFVRSFRLSPTVWGPRVDISGGMAKYKNQVDSVSGGLTTLEYNGYKFGLDGYIPVTKDQSWGVGANLFFTLFTRMNESPATSGSADNTVNTFGFYAVKKIGVNLKVKMNIDFELYSSSFSGSSAISASQKHTLLGAGIYYMF